MSRRVVVRSLVRTSLVALLALAGASSSALAQKADPKPLEPYKEPVLDVNSWGRAYEQAGRPRLLVLAGFGTDRHQAMDPGQVLSNLDSSAVSHKIRSALIGELNAPAADVEMVDDNALRAVVSRLGANTSLAGELEASELLRQQLGADQVILVRLMETGRAGSPFSVVVESSNLARGRRGASFPFDWKGGTDVRNIKDNMRAVAIKYAEDFAQRSINPVRYTVQLFGLSTLDMQKNALDAMNSLAGLRGKARTRTGGTLHDATLDVHESLNEYELAFVAGNEPDQTTLAAEIADALRSRFGMLTEPKQSETGRIALRIRGTSPVTPITTATAPATTPAPAPVTAAHTPDSPADAPPSAEDDSLASSLKALYADRQSPRVVVMVNRAATIEEWDDWRRYSSGTPGGLNADNVIVIAAGTNPNNNVGGANGGKTGAANENPDQFVQPGTLELWARQVEQAVSRKLAEDFGLSNQISPDLARASLLVERDSSRKYMGGDELLGLLRKNDAADVAVVGFGRIISGIAGFEMVYTFEAVELATSRRLGTTTVTSPLRGLSAADAMQRSSLTFATRAAKSVAGAVKETWSLPGPLTVTISGFQGEGESRVVAGAIRTHGTRLKIRGGASYDTVDSLGVSTFSAEFAGPIDEIGEELDRIVKAAELPFTLDVTRREASQAVIRIVR